MHKTYELYVKRFRSPLSYFLIQFVIYDLYKIDKNIVFVGNGLGAITPNVYTNNDFCLD